MVQLNKIEISGARRLGNNVLIEFGEGATILAAPNGTGKTTIFEAIELAITNSIQRLKNEMGAFVSSNSGSMSVYLEFNDNQYTKVILDKYGNKTREGDLLQILKVRPDVSIPYLYKMTHFFEQNSKNWFVSIEETEAGKLLGYLPISRDVQNILLKKTGLLRAFTSVQKALDSELKLIKQTLQLFEQDMNKIEKREYYMTKDEFEKTVNKVKLLVQRYNIEMINVDNDQLDKLFVSLELVKSNITEKKDINQSVLSKLAAFENRIDLYLDNQQLLKDKNEIIDLYKKQKNDKEKEMQDYSTAYNEVNLKIKAEEEIKEKAERILSQFSKFEIKEKNIKEKKEDLKKCQSDLDKISQEIKKKEEEVEIYRKKQDKQEILNSMIKAKKKNLFDLDKKIKKMKEWKNKKSEMDRNIEELNALENKIANMKARKEKIMLILQENKKEYQNKQEYLLILKKSEEETLNALFVLKKIIGPDTKVCPVCQAVYGSGILEKKISKSLEYINPLLIKADKEEKEASLLVIENEKIISQLNTELAKFSEMHKDLMWKMTDLTDSIAALRKELLIEDKEADAEQKRIEYEIVTLQEQITDLRSQAELLPCGIEDELHMLEEVKRKNEREAAKLKKQTEDIKSEIENDEIDIEILKNRLKNENREEQLSQKEKCVIVIEQYGQAKVKWEKECARLRDELKKLEDNIITEEDLIAMVSTSQSNVISEWKWFDICDVPDKEAARTKSDELKEQGLQLEEDLQSFYTLKKKLSVWKLSQEREEIELRLKEKAGDKSIKEYYQDLCKQIAEKESCLRDIDMKRKAAEFFLDEIAAESEKIQSQILQINHTWKKILKRIVVNPLIADAPLLENKNAYNKSVASTKALIHDKRINMAEIASEGQIADLQLSFILAMANKYSWTPWKALLLDDPMQHHDLVHASSVVDVLRDYIADYGYQVMLSTHDLMQADYYARKFKNDGIKYKIYQLVPEKGGVSAERVQ